MNGYIHGVMRAAAEAFDLPEPMLEIGARIVSGQESLAIRRLFEGREYLGVDLEIGPGVDQTADVESLPFPDSTFGTVIALNVFEHTPCFWRGVEEVFRVLRPDGVAIVSVPFYFHIHNYPGDYWRVTPQAMHRLLDRCPTRIVGTQGSRTRPMHVFGLGFASDAKVTDRQWERFRALTSRYAKEPVDWRTRWLFPLARAICGRRPFEPWLDLNRGALERTVVAASALTVSPK
jgi:SAM-dependent methyltransferase